MKIFLDFDDVVFDTKQFNIRRTKIFNDHGIPEEIFIQYFEKFKANRRKGELVTYSQKRHIESLKNILNVDVNFKELEKELLEFFKENAKEYVVCGFKEFAEKVEKENLYLLSYGDIEYQKEKIENSGVEKYFNEVIITDGLKSETIAERFKNNKGEIAINEKVYFIDDRVAHLKDVKEKIPEIETFLMSSGNGRHDDEQENEFCDGVIKSFVEMEEVLERNGELKR